MTRAKWTAIRYTAEAVFAFVAVVLAVVHFEEFLKGINWQLVLLLCGAVAFVVALYRWQMQPQDENRYDALQMFTTPEGRADLDKHLTIFSFALAVWLVVNQALHNQPVTELMLGVLGFFVLKRGAQGFSDAMARRGPPVDQSQNVNVLPNANIQQAPNAQQAQPAADAMPPPQSQQSTAADRYHAS